MCECVCRSGPELGVGEKKRKKNLLVKKLRNWFNTSRLRLSEYLRVRHNLFLPSSHLKIIYSGLGRVLIKALATLDLHRRFFHYHTTQSTIQTREYVR
jgi:hypothetical protein